MRPKGVTVIGCYCLMTGVYLCSLSAIFLIMPTAAPALKRMPLLLALKHANPYITIGLGIVWASIGWGLFQIYEWARWTAQILLGFGVIVGVFQLTRITHLNWILLIGCGQIVLRAVAVSYLSNQTVAKVFLRKKFERELSSTLGSPH